MTTETLHDFKTQLLETEPCKDGLEFAKACNFDRRKMWDTCPRSDWMIWGLREFNLITKPQAVVLAIVFAEHVLEHFEKKYPKDKRPRKAIKAAKAWLENPTEENRKSAYAAYAAAYAAYAAYADAAAQAAYAAADAYAAYAAAYAADAAANGRSKERQWQADKIRELIPYPF